MRYAIVIEYAGPLLSKTGFWNPFSCLGPAENPEKIGVSGFRGSHVGQHLIGGTILGLRRTHRSS